MTSSSEYYLATMYQEVASRVKVYSGAGETLMIQHDDLVGLGDDDHPQYLLRTELLTGISMTERADPVAPVVNNAMIYIRDNGAGKTQLVVRFPTGAIQVLSTEP